MSSNSPARRVVLLGASNLARGFAMVVQVARCTWDEPIEIMAAMGHGRSYGQDSQVFGRKISGIFPCALWQDLQSRPRLPTAALVTDIGNDLLYGVKPERIVEWVAGCVEQLAEVGATTVVTQLPIESVERMSAARFRVLSRLLYPHSQLTLDVAKEQMRAVNAALAELGESKKIAVIPVSELWYGFDAIHLRRRIWRHAWPELLATWRELGAPIEVAPPTLRTSAYLATLAPWERTLFGVRRRAAQPSGRFADGTTISLY